MKFVSISETRFVNLDQVTDMEFRDGGKLRLFFGFLSPLEDYAFADVDPLFVDRVLIAAGIKGRIE